MKEYIIYNYGGGENHGCEALVRSILSILKVEKVTVISDAPQQDYNYLLHNITAIYPAHHNYTKFSLSFILAYLRLKFKANYFPMDVMPYRKSLEKFNKNTIAISIGGDVYCYDDYPKFIQLHKIIHKKKSHSILLGCSLNSELFSDPNFIRDIKRYDLIIARESITYESLKKNGIENIVLYPDPAFQLERVDLPLPEGFVEGNTVGINISPMIMSYEQGGNIALRNYDQLIEYIIEQTDMQIALIPHVVWPNNDDRIPLARLYEKYSHSGRVVMIEDHNCMELKGYIARCRFMVAARTHASIAAYSSCVPTLVVGYSVKAKGIAKDLFGTFENYVLPVQSLTSENELSQAFGWIVDNEKGIRDHLQATMPKYCARALKIKDELQKIKM